MNQFNLIIVGTGGQGQITLLKILAQAAIFEGYMVRTSELHGLSQRGGSVEVQARFGQEIFSPLILQGKADLILSLELQETLRALYYANKKTKFLINDEILAIPQEKIMPKEEILTSLRNFSKNIELAEAAKICQEKLGKKVLAGVYLLSLASFKKLLPLKPNSILKAIKKIIPGKYLELNLKTFRLAKR